MDNPISLEARPEHVTPQPETVTTAPRPHALSVSLSLIPITLSLLALILSADSYANGREAAANQLALDERRADDKVRDALELLGGVPGTLCVYKYTSDEELIKAAASAVREARRLAPDHVVGPLYAEGHICAAQRLYVKALDAFGQVLQLEPDGLYASTAHRSCAMLFRKLGKYDEALAMDTAAIARNPDSYDAHLGKGLTLNRLGRHAEALCAFDEALDSIPNAVIAQTYKGIELIALQRLDEAIGILKGAIVDDSVAAGPRAILAIALSKSGRASEAKDALAAPAQCNDAFDFLARGAAMLALGDAASANEAFRHAKEIDPLAEEDAYRRGF